MQVVLGEAIENYRRQKFVEESNVAFAALRHDPKAWVEEQEERKLWEATTEDGTDPPQQP